MHNQRFALVFALLLVAGCGGAIDDSPTAETTEALTGGLDLNAYCQKRFGANAWATFLDPNNAYSWVCVVGSAQYGMDLQTACVQQYGSNAIVELGSGSDPYSWYCSYGCTNNAQCGSGNFCHKPNGQCGAVGRCDTIPVGLCAANLYVCGCNGRSYPSPCFAFKASTSVAYGGACH